jgi:hypothetical protein
MAGGQKRWGKRTIEAQIEVDGFKLRWKLRSEPQRSSEHGDEGLSIAVERADGSFRELILEYPIPNTKRPGTWQPISWPLRPKVSPKIVAADIRRAIVSGWDPNSRGKPFVFQVPEIPS